MECSFFLYNFRSLCIGGKLGCMKLKENLGLLVVLCIKGDIGVLVILCMLKNDLGLSDVD